MPDFDLEKNESIMIGKDILIYVVEIRGDKVFLGVRAPRNISIHRKETRDLISRQTQLIEQQRMRDIQTGY